MARIPIPGENRLFYDTTDKIVYEQMPNGDFSPIRTNGNGHIAIKSSDIPVYGNVLKTNIWGDELQKQGTYSGIEVVVDMRRYGRAFLAVLPSAAVATHQVQVAWSHSGAVADKHSSASLIAATAGNISADMAIHDLYAHITITEAAGTETIYAYISGRELA